MNYFIPKRKRSKARPFELLNMNDADIRAMFLSVPVKSLADWMKYYIGKEKPEICKIIAEVSLYRI